MGLRGERNDIKGDTPQTDANQDGGADATKKSNHIQPTPKWVRWLG
ncbi:MAG: hypothetical protein ABI876_03780 [Bacteroidota bacterium]